MTYDGINQSMGLEHFLGAQSSFYPGSQGVNSSGDKTPGLQLGAFTILGGV